MAKQRFADLLESHIQNVVQRRFQYASLDPVTMRSIKRTIEELITSIFQRSTYKLSEISLSWLTCQIFKRLRVGPDASMANLIVINEHKLSDLPIDDVKLLYQLFDVTDMANELREELTARDAR